MRKILALSILYTIFATSYSQTKYPYVVLETTFGNMVIHLYSETPMHCDNFTKLVTEGYYNNQLFHRVIKNFMIQTGDPDSKNAAPNQLLGRGGPAYTIPAEFIPSYYHKYGAIAAARQPDQVNPAKASSGSQFYIVQGKVYNKAELDAMVQSGMHIKFTESQIDTYITKGGTPHLDYSYTVFGELVEGFDVLNKISSVGVDKNNRPLQDVRIIKAYLKK